MTRDLRKYAKDSNVRFAVGGLLLLFTVGVGLIYLVYGAAAAMMGFLCILGGLVPIGFIFLFLYLLDWVTKRAGGE